MLSTLKNFGQFSTSLLSLNNIPLPPLKQTFVARKKIPTTIEQREKILKNTGYNVFAFPAMFTVVDYLSESGSSAMFDSQWSAMMFGDESYGRNTGYFVILETCRDIFERGNNPKKSINHILTGNNNAIELLDDLILGGEDSENSFFNGGKKQLQRPNSFLTPQGRCAEYLLFSTISQILSQEFPNKKFYVPSNGFFDTTRANCDISPNFQSIDLFHTNLFDDFPVEDIEKKNPFKGNLEPKKLENVIKAKGKDSIPFVLLTVTNNSGAGQPVSMKNIKEVKKICDKYEIPLWFDACRFSENAFMIKSFEEEYKNKTIQEIVQEMFKHADGFHISFKKDGLANIGGGCFFKDKSLLREKYTKMIKKHDPEMCLGKLMKQTQILTQGNDSYGGIDGRSIFSISKGLYEITDETFLKLRAEQSRYLAKGLIKAGVKGVLTPPGMHAIYIDVNQFFPERHWSKFAGVGLTIELLRKYAIRTCELGAFAFEWDQRESLPDPLPPNLVRLAIPRNVYSREHLDYTIAAVAELYKNKDSIPNMKITGGKNIPLRHFQSYLEPIKE